MQNFSSVGALPPAGICLVAVSKIFFPQGRRSTGRRQGSFHLPSKSSGKRGNVPFSCCLIFSYFLLTFVRFSGPTYEISEKRDRPSTKVS